MATSTVAINQTSGTTRVWHVLGAITTIEGRMPAPGDDWYSTALSVDQLYADLELEST